MSTTNCNYWENHVLIVNNFDNGVFTTCSLQEVPANIERGRAFYDDEKRLYEKNLVEHPNLAQEWQRGLERSEKILQSGLRAVTWEEYETLQREKWLSKEPKEITAKEYDEALNVLPPKNWIRNERYSMFFIGECTTMSFYGQYLYDRKTGKHYYALTDILDESTWLDKMLGL